LALCFFYYSDQLNISDIIELVVLQPTATLTAILTLFVGASIIVSTLCAGGLVLRKVRIDRLVENQNANMRTIPVSTIPIDGNIGMQQEARIRSENTSLSEGGNTINPAASEMSVASADSPYGQRRRRV